MHLFSFIYVHNTWNKGWEGDSLSPELKLYYTVTHTTGDDSTRWFSLFPLTYPSVHRELILKEVTWSPSSLISFPSLSTPCVKFPWSIINTVAVSWLVQSGFPLHGAGGETEALLNKANKATKWTLGASTSQTWDNVNEFYKHHIERNRPYTKEHLLHGSILYKLQK